MSIRVAICDDDKSTAEYIASLVNRWASDTSMQVKTENFPSAEAFLFQDSDCKNYDILLLDIEMGKLSGIDLAKIVRSKNDVVQIVFITGYSDFISEGYDVAALHYLMKPISPEKLSSVLDRAAVNIRKTERTVILTVDGASVRIKVDTICYVEAFSHTIAVTTDEKTYNVRMSMSDAEKLLDEGFVRCHRSYLVGLKFISHITKTDVTLDNGKVLPLSRSAAAAVHQAFVAYYKNEG